MKQLYEKINNEYKEIFPLNYIQNLIDSESGNTLASILQTFNNIYIPYQGNPQDTRYIIPESLRRKGLWITYNNGEEYITEYYKGDANDIQEYWAEDYNWEIVPNLKYVQDNASKLPNGIITADKLSPALLQLIQSSGKVVNMADDEDIEEVNSTLKFKDRKYNSELASGKGYKILRKNWTKVGGKMINLLTQDMINEANTIYEIRYDFDLNEKEITIPEGCVLKFNGGSLNNGNINLNNTYIITKVNNIFKDIIFSGYISNNKVNIDWFNNVNYTSIFNLIANSNNVESLYLSNKTYYVDDEIYFNHCLNFIGKNTIIKIDGNCKINYLDKTKTVYSIFNFKNADNDLSFNNITFLVDAKSHGFVVQEDTSDNRDYVFIYTESINSLSFKNCNYLFNDEIYSPNTFFKTYAYNVYLFNTKIELNSISHYGSCFHINYGFKPTDVTYTRCIIDNCVFISRAGDETMSFYRATSDYETNRYIKVTNTKIIAYANNYRSSKLINLAITINSEATIDNSNSFVIFDNCDFSVIGKTEKSRIYCHAASDIKNNEAKINGINKIYFNNCNFNGGYSVDEYGLFRSTRYAKIKYYINNCEISSNENINLIGQTGLETEYVFNNCNINNLKEIYYTLNDDLELLGKLSFINCNIELKDSISTYWINRCMASININNSKFVDSNKSAYTIIVPNGRSLLNNDIKITDVIITNSYFNNLYVDNIISINDDYYVEMYSRGKTILVSENSPYSYPIKIYNKNNFKAKIFNTEIQSEFDTSSNLYKVEILSNLFNGKYKITLIKNDDNSINYMYYFNSKNDYELKYIKNNNIKNYFLNRNNNIDNGNIIYDIDNNRYCYWDGEKLCDFLGESIEYLKTGNFSQKPSNPNIGFAYFCTDKQTSEGATDGIMIYHKGDNVWVDALGRVVS